MHILASFSGAHTLMLLHPPTTFSCMRFKETGERLVQTMKESACHTLVGRAHANTVALPSPPPILPTLVGFSMGIQRGCQHFNSIGMSDTGLPGNQGRRPTHSNLDGLHIRLGRELLRRA